MSILTFSCSVFVQKRKTLCYVDYDQATGEEDVVQSAAALTWPGTASSVQMESSVCAMHCARESVTYDDEDDSLSAADPRIIRGRFYNNQFAVNHNNPTNWMHTTASRYMIFYIKTSIVFILVRSFDIGSFYFWISLFAQQNLYVYSQASRSKVILIIVGIYMSSSIYYYNTKEERSDADE